MNIYAIIVAIVLFIVFLFILFRIILKKDLKLSLFDSSSGSAVIPPEKNINIGKYSNQSIAYKNSLDVKSKKNFLVKNKTKKPKSLGNKTKLKRPRKKFLSKKDDSMISLIDNDAKKIELKENAVNLNKKESINEPPKRKKDYIGLKVNSFEDIYKFLGNSGISDIVHYFETNNVELINRIDNEKRISSSADFEDSIKNKITNFLNNQYDNLRGRVSELRKNGKNMDDAEFILLSVPLKIKLFSATFSKKDFDLVIKKIESIKELIKSPG